MKCRPFILLACVVGFWAGIMPGWAASFTSSNGAFTLDLPAGWKEAAQPPVDSVLSVEKGTSRIDIKNTNCTTETCIEGKINSDLAEIKRKKMTVVGNAYTGEEIKRIEFSTGEPFFYISFYTPKNDFGAGYFLISNQAYSILARNLTYAETDLIFSFIAPQTPSTAGEPVAPSLEVALQDPRAYEGVAVPDVAEETVSAPKEQFQPAAPPVVSQPKPSRFTTALRQLKGKLNQASIHSFLSARMPPYVRKLGRVFDIFVLLGIGYLLTWAVAAIFRICIGAKPFSAPANPNSLYPIHFKRLYGTPSVIWRAKDNQGNILVSLSSRWDSFFLLSGMLIIIATGCGLALLGLTEKLQLFPTHTFAYDTAYSICSLLVPLGIMIFFCGVVWSQLVLREISLFDRSGKKAAIILQKGFGVKEERYEIYFARSKEILVATRKRFSLRRTWCLLNAEGHPLAHAQERSVAKALLRKAIGHLWGFLRADYNIDGQMDSTGAIQNEHGFFNRFTCYLDKPQAINARDLLVLSLLISVRDKDKWYPWFN